MPFSANPTDGATHSEWDCDYYAKGGKWLRRFNNIVTQVGGADIGSVAGANDFFHNRNNVQTWRSIKVRNAKNLIKVHCAFSTNGGQETIGLGIGTDGGWTNFSAKDVNFSADNGFSSWGDGGAEVKDWFSSKAFSTAIWMHDVSDPDRGVKNGQKGLIDITINKVDNKCFVTWDVQHTGETGRTMWTHGQLLINNDIGEIVALDLRAANGNYIDGRVSVEWW